MVFAFLGTPEIIIILVIALVVFGPQKLPEIGRQVGSALRELNKMRSDVQRAFDIDELTRDHSSYGSNYNSTYGSTSHYDSQPYGETYPATTTYEPSSESTRLLEGHAESNGTVSDTESTSEHTADTGQMSLEYEPLPAPTIAEPAALPHTVSVSAGAAVAHDLDNHGHSHEHSAISNGVTTASASSQGHENASAASPVTEPVAAESHKE